MQNNRFSHARRIFLGLGAALLLTMVGCQSPTITNLTPLSPPQNASQIYTFSARVRPNDIGFVENTLSVSLVIEGQSILMKKSALGNDIYEVDYQVPAGRTELAYYIQSNFQVKYANGLVYPREEFTPLQHAQILSRYVIAIESNRGPVGALVGISGRGFTPNDIVYFDDAPVRTAFESARSLSFYVPGFDANRNYRVAIGSGANQMPVGTFRIDGPVGGTPTSTGFATPNGGALLVSPGSLTMKKGDKTSLTFTSPVTATTGGLLIDVTTDVPESVIMPEVMIPTGSNTTTVTVEAGRPGTGSLFVRGPGVKELVIPVTVQ